MYDEHQEKVSKLLQGKQHSLEVAKDVTSTASDNDFLSLYPVISKDLKSLKSRNPPKVDVFLSYLSFTPGQWTDINLGELEEKGRKWEMCCEVGKTGDSPGNFQLAISVAVAPSGEVAVADCLDNQVVLCSSEGQPKAKIPLHSRPYRITAVHSHDNQLVVVDDTKYVKVFNKKNKLAFQFPTVPQSAVDKTRMNLRGVAVRKDGTILVGDVNRMVWTEHSPTDGALLRTIPVQTPPWFLAVDDHNDRVVVSGGGSQKVDIATNYGITLATIRPTIKGQQVQLCHGVCCNNSGFCIVVRNGPNTGHVHHYDLDGNFLIWWAQGLSNPYGITFTPYGKFLVADSYSVKMYHKV
ncbi:uncharacterized protein LOC110985174 [Acanthaster planci]|uniref:Uncharacterized protein LOC110985174 n=1 Tax=Acanthaster planci TaxID=133434 RepID=A0A8B7ZA62_ACAPL|nr:uncharacterized protein LOC110985174 [Acanthaster planci]